MKNRSCLMRIWSVFFLQLRQQKETPSPVKKEEQRAEPQLSDANVVEPIPRTMHPRATALLSRLKAKPDVITWDKTGQVKIEGEIIPNSNISDLVSDAIRSRRNFDPTDSKDFFEVLNKLNVPKDLARNEECWKEALGETSGTMPTPKSSIRSSPHLSEDFEIVQRKRHASALGEILILLLLNKIC